MNKKYLYIYFYLIYSKTTSFYEKYKMFKNFAGPNWAFRSSIIVVAQRCLIIFKNFFFLAHFDY